MNATTLSRGRCSHLTEVQRQDLVELIAANPLATCTQIAALFEARVGRSVSEHTVRRVWVHGYQANRIGARGRNLSDAQRAELTRLCLVAAPDYNRAAIARRFEQATGRPIKVASVRKFLRNNLGIIEDRPLGRPRKGGVPG